MRRTVRVFVMTVLILVFSSLGPLSSQTPASASDLSVPNHNRFAVFEAFMRAT